MKPLDYGSMGKLLNYAWDKTLKRDVKQKMIVRILAGIMSDIVLINEYAKTESLLAWNELDPDRQKLLIEQYLKFVETPEFKEMEVEIQNHR